ncbi:hypothetical protein JCM10450v2_004315 [Rhodotorula kratochvilovae]
MSYPASSSASTSSSSSSSSLDLPSPTAVVPAPLPSPRALRSPPLIASPPLPAKSRPSKLFPRRSRQSSSGTSTLVGSPFLLPKASLDSLKFWELASSPPPVTDIVVHAPPRGARAPRRLPRKAVPLAQGDEVLASPTTAKTQHAPPPRPPRSLRRPSPPFVDGLWCDSGRALPALPTDASRSSSSSSTTSSSGPFPAHRRSSTALPSSPSPSSPAPLSLSPRLARLAAFASTLSQLEGDAALARRLSLEVAAGESSFALPELELPWLPTLFPLGTPTLDGGAFPGASARGSPALTARAFARSPSPVLSESEEGAASEYPRSSSASSSSSEEEGGDADVDAASLSSFGRRSSGESASSASSLATCASSASASICAAKRPARG